MKRWHMVGMVTVLVVVVGLVIYRTSSFEPQYEGQTLTQWLDRTIEAGRFQDQEHPELNPDWLVFKKAIQQMGTNVIPFLLGDLQAKTTKLYSGSGNWTHGKIERSVLPRKWLDGIDQFLQSERNQAFKDHERGVYGFWLLGTNASSFYPELIELTSSSNRDDRFWGYGAFASTRPPAEIFVPPTLRLIKDPDEEIRTTAAMALQGLYPQYMEIYKIYDSFPDLKPSPTNQVIVMP